MPDVPGGDTPERADGWASRRIRRDEFLRRSLTGGLGLMAGGILLPGCGTSSDTKTGTTTGAAVGSPKRGGTLRLGSLPSSSAWPTLDPHTTLGWATDARTNNIFEQLLLYDVNFDDYAMLLAEEFTQEKPDTWLIRVKPDVTFHDGKTLTADDVIFTIKRMADQKLGTITGAALTSIDPNGFKKLDDRTVRVTLNRPDATIADVMTSWAAGVVPEGFDPRTPVGTGPFKHQSYTPGRQSVAVRNPDYWQNGLPYVDELVIINFEDDSARANALLSGQVDMIDFVPYPFVPTIAGNKDFKILEAEGTGLHAPFTMRVDQAPFNITEVRQALRLMIDREQMVEQALAGHGTVGNDVFGNLDPAYDGSLPQRTQDIEQAKSLLKKAGQENLTVELVAGPAITGIVEAAQVLAQQAKAAGVTVNVKKVDTSILFGPNYTKWPFSMDFWGTKRYLYQAGVMNVTDAPSNATHWPSAEHADRYMSLYNEAQGLVDLEKRNEVIREMQKMDYDVGGHIVWGFSNLVDAHSAKVTGLTANKGELPLAHYDFRKVSFV
jgi:peptide/nickel transport system substrate-binding protein